MTFLSFRFNLFRGMKNDVSKRLPFYAADWTVDAWNYRIIPATIYMYFANVLPAIAFALDMFSKTHNSYGVNEVLLASVLGAILFSVFAGQPLCIVGVTGPISVFNYTVYEIMVPRGTPYFQFMCWVCLWSMIMHFAIAITNGVNGLRFVTKFSCDIFGFYVAFIYLQKGIQVLTRQFDKSDIEGFLSIMIALLVLIFGYLCQIIGENSPLFWRPIRRFLSDYGTPLVIVFFTGFIHIGKMRGYDIQKLPISHAFQPTADRLVRHHGWFIHFWEGITIGDVFLAIPFAILLTILFYFDHNVSSLICQGKEFPLTKPASFHWDFFLLGISTGVSGILGIPAPNGLIPQAPFHTMSLCVIKEEKARHEFDGENGDVTATNNNTSGYRSIIDKVIEQRVSNFAQGLMILGTMSRPLLVVLSLVPQAVLAGLFWVMGLSALQSNGIVLKLYYLSKDHILTSTNDPLRKVRIKYIYLFVVIELIAFGATFAITQTIAAVGFPAILMLFAAFTGVLPKIFSSEELAILDSPTASEFTMESVLAKEQSWSSEGHNLGPDRASSLSLSHYPEDTGLHYSGSKHRLSGLRQDENNDNPIH
ncbi:HCO3 transporter family-domain-containing protein [Lipomyces japonicus]|uniref:HCO3 transporter family-domain-containing protein n=1 Tax=Lipomyces japonicus TaxID=56871 RepID=UPI0034D0082D